MASGSAASPGAASPGAPIPQWLSVKGLSQQGLKRRYLSASTGNLHGLQAGEFQTTKWPLPKMFGAEKYAYSLIDIEDPRFLEECSEMSKKLLHYYGDSQIFDLEWRETYGKLTLSEKRLSNLPKSAAQKARDELEKTVKKHKTYLLELQEQKDLYSQAIEDIYTRCATIKQGIKNENDLEELRQEMTGRVKQRFLSDDGFWKSSFNCTRPEGVDRVDDFLDE